MSITDELRELAHVFSNVWLDKDWSVTYTTGISAPSLESVNLEKHIKDIADRIDVEHQKELENARAIAGVYGFDCGFASADDWFVDHSEELEEHGWVRSAKDADGEFWRYGDKLEIENGLTVDIIGVSGDWLFYATENGFIHRTRAHDKRHYHEPTIEDVLRELVDKAQALSNVDDEDELVADFAKRLRLAGEDE